MVINFKIVSAKKMNNSNCCGVEIDYANSGGGEQISKYGKK